MVSTNIGVYIMGSLENIELMKQFIMEADCLESKTFVPIIWEREKYLQPSNIDEFYLQLWTDIHRTVNHPELEDMIQDITLHVLESATIFETYEDALSYYYRSVFNTSNNLAVKVKNQERLRDANLEIPTSTPELKICNACLNLRPMLFVYKGGDYCMDCTPYIVSLILKARMEGREE
jgi:hypothetical protein